MKRKLIAPRASSNSQALSDTCSPSVHRRRVRHAPKNRNFTCGYCVTAITWSNLTNRWSLPLFAVIRDILLLFSIREKSVDILWTEWNCPMENKNRESSKGQFNFLQKRKKVCKFFSNIRENSKLRNNDGGKFASSLGIRNLHGRRKLFTIKIGKNSKFSERENSISSVKILNYETTKEGNLRTFSAFEVSWEEKIFFLKNSKFSQTEDSNF